MRAGIGVVLYISIGIFIGILKTGSKCWKWHPYNDKQKPTTAFLILFKQSHKMDAFSSTHISP